MSGFDSPESQLVERTLRAMGRHPKQAPPQDGVEWMWTCDGPPAKLVALRPAGQIGVVLAGGLQVTPEHQAAIRKLRPAESRRFNMQLRLALTGAGVRFKIDTGGHRIPVQIGLETMLFLEALSMQSIMEAHNRIVDAIIKTKVLVEGAADGSDENIPTVVPDSSQGSSVSDWAAHLVAVNAEVLEELTRRARESNITTGQVVARLLDMEG